MSTENTNQEEPKMKTKILNERIKDLQFVTIANCKYIGKKVKTENGFKISDAVDVSEITEFDKAIIKWIKTDNLSQLESIEEEGFSSILSKKFNEQQCMEIDMIAAKASYKMKYALKNLENDSF